AACWGLGTYRKSTSSSLAGGSQSTRASGLADRTPFSMAYRIALLSTMRLRFAVLSAAGSPLSLRDSASSAARVRSGLAAAVTFRECLATHASAATTSAGGASASERETRTPLSVGVARNAQE